MVDESSPLISSQDLSALTPKQQKAASRFTSERIATSNDLVESAIPKISSLLKGKKVAILSNDYSANVVPGDRENG